MTSEQLDDLIPYARSLFERVEVFATGRFDDYLLSVSDGAFSKIYGGPTDFMEEFPKEKDDVQATK